MFYFCMAHITYKVSVEFTVLQEQQFTMQPMFQRWQGKTPLKTFAHKEKMEETPGEEIQSEILPLWMSRGLIEYNE